MNSVSKLVHHLRRTPVHEESVLSSFLDLLRTTLADDNSRARSELAARTPLSRQMDRISTLSGLMVSKGIKDPRSWQAIFRYAAQPINEVTFQDSIQCITHGLSVNLFDSRFCERVLSTLPADSLTMNDISMLLSIASNLPAPDPELLRPLRNAAWSRFHDLPAKDIISCLKTLMKAGAADDPQLFISAAEALHVAAPNMSVGEVASTLSVFASAGQEDSRLFDSLLRRIFKKLRSCKPFEAAALLQGMGRSRARHEAVATAALGRVCEALEVERVEAKTVGNPSEIVRLSTITLNAVGRLRFALFPTMQKIIDKVTGIVLSSEGDSPGLSENIALLCALSAVGGNKPEIVARIFNQLAKKYCPNEPREAGWELSYEMHTEFLSHLSPTQLIHLCKGSRSPEGILHPLGLRGYCELVAKTIKRNPESDTGNILVGLLLEGRQALLDVLSMDESGTVPPLSIDDLIQIRSAISRFNLFKTLHEDEVYSYARKSTLHEIAGNNSKQEVLLELESLLKSPLKNGPLGVYLVREDQVKQAIERLGTGDASKQEDQIKPLKPVQKSKIKEELRAQKAADKEAKSQERIKALREKAEAKRRLMAQKISRMIKATPKKVIGFAG